MNDYGVFKAIRDWEFEYGDFEFDEDEEMNYKELAYYILNEYLRDNIEDLIKEHIEGYDYMGYFRDFLNPYDNDDNNDNEKTPCQNDDDKSYLHHTVPELKKKCKECGIKGYSKQNKATLIDLLTKNDNK